MPCCIPVDGNGKEKSHLQDLNAATAQQAHSAYLAEQETESGSAQNDLRKKLTMKGTVKAFTLNRYIKNSQSVLEANFT